MNNVFYFTIFFSFLKTQPIDLSLDWNTNNNIPFSTELENVIESEVASLASVKGIIVIYKGQVISENYYNESSIDDIYDIWSVTKSFISTLIGQAVDMGLMDDPDRSASNFFPDYNIDYIETIKLHHLLSMSSGYEQNYGFLDQSTEEILSVNHSVPDSFFYNNSACHLNAHALFYSTGQTPYEFANTHLFPYLGIEDPDWTGGYLNINNGSYDLRLNLRDMVKLGQLYIQDGYSGNDQILSKEWIERATSPQVETNWGNYGYGYLWWLPEIGFSYLANGAGGQFIAVFPEYDLVIGTRSQGDAQELQSAIYFEIAPLFDRIPIVINEILATNNNCCTDENGNNNEYIEIYNYGNDSIDVAGFFLTNDANNPDSYIQIPTGNESTIIAPDEFLLFWSDDPPEQGVLHIGALLSNLGGNLSIYNQDTLIIDQMSYSVQAPDIAYARLEDGNEEWTYMEPTPNLANSTILKNKQESFHPISISLNQNYPNPFNPITTIRYDLTEPTNVEISIYDIMGKEVKNLVNTHQNSGYKSVIWNATNNQGHPVSAGVYLYSIEAGNLRQKKKMILLK